MNIEYDKSCWEVSINYEKAIADIEQLNEGETCFYPESDYGHGFIQKYEGRYDCYSIPMYGGVECLKGSYLNAKDAFEEILSWT